MDRKERKYTYKGEKKKKNIRIGENRGRTKMQKCKIKKKKTERKGNDKGTKTMWERNVYTGRKRERIRKGKKKRNLRKKRQ